MSALHESYLRCLNRLREEVEATENDEVLSELDIFQMRLAANLKKIRIQGDTKEDEAARYQILEHLNKITRELYHSSFDDYCQSIGRPIPSVADIGQSTIREQTLNFPPESIADNGSEEPPSPYEPLEPVQDFILAAKEHITALQMSIKKAQEVFSSDIISQEQCEEILSSFPLFDCSNFPDDNHLLRAKTQLQGFNEKVNQLRDFCEICDDVDRPSKKTRKKIRDLIGMLDKLFYYTTHFRK